MQKTYLCIDLKSFYASVECVERGLDPMTTNLIVADPDRSDKTICLAVTPAMKALGVRNRCRVFEIPTNIKYIVAPPRMQKYIDYAAEIYGVYLRYLSPEDIHVYSIDEAFIDVTPYLDRYGSTPKKTAEFLINKIFEQTGVRAACGIGTNLYLAKIALDITAKHSPDFIGMLDEESYRATLWEHRPLTDFWRIGGGTVATLERHGIYTMRDIAYANEERLYKWFGIDAELLIDHAWGREPTEISDIKEYRPKTNCLTVGQVLMRDYSFEEGALVLREMMDGICLDMVDKNLVTSSVTVSVGYSNSLNIPHAKGTAALEVKTNADRIIIPAVEELYGRIVEKDKMIRRLNVCCNNVTADTGLRQVSLFEAEDGVDVDKNHRLQRAILDIKKKYGKNAMLRGMDFEAAATARERNKQIGGHKSGEG
ncbi:MAG: DNA repair protein [Eubacterium sp.]|nr:DNA repair protein [Eubacterium sp.]